MKPDYSKMTTEEFDAILGELVEETPAGHLLGIEGVYEALSEEFNNEVLDLWAKRQKPEAVHARPANDSDEHHEKDDNHYI